MKSLLSAMVREEGNKPAMELDIPSLKEQIFDDKVIGKL